MYFIHFYPQARWVHNTYSKYFGAARHCLAVDLKQALQCERQVRTNTFSVVVVVVVKVVFVVVVVVVVEVVV